MLHRLLLLILLLPAACVAPSDGVSNVDRFGYGLDGFDPVSYHRQNGPVKGDPRFIAEFDGVQYLFASEETKTRFLQSPDYYVPRYGGWCAYAMAGGEKVEVDPECFLLNEEGLFLFYRSYLIDTRARWQQEGPEELKKRADEAWGVMAQEASYPGGWSERP